jgi:UDP-glucose 4-epimerase
MAALVSVPESMSKPSECVDINVHGLLNVLEEAAAAKVRKLVFASSAAIYGDNPTVPKIESMLPEPKSPYAITKLDGEYYLDMFRREGRLETAAIRFFNVFGPRQDPKGAYAAAVPIFIEKAVKGEDIMVYGDGEQTRDFIYVKDIVGALTFAAETAGVTGVFNAGYGGQITINKLAGEILAKAGTASRRRTCRRCEAFTCQCRQAASRRMEVTLHPRRRPRRDFCIFLQAVGRRGEEEKVIGQ